MVSEKRNAENVTGVSNVAYDLMSVLTNKLEGIAAMEQYKRDAQGDQDAMECLEQIERQDREQIDKLRQLVVSRLGEA